MRFRYVLPLLAAVTLWPTSSPLFAQPAETAEVALPTTVYSSPEETQPLGIGESLPNAKLRTIDGEATTLPEAVAGKPSVIVFYRGGWCPVCNKHLADLAKVEPELKKQGVQLIAISPDTPERLSKAAGDEKLSYTLYSDTNHAAMKALGIAFAVDDKTNSMLRGYDIILEDWSGSADRVLPVPAVFVTDAAGKIVFVHTNPDYTQRLSGEEVLKAVAASTAKK